MKKPNSAETPYSRLEEIVAQIRKAYDTANYTVADGYNEEAWAIFAALSDVEIRDMVWYADMRCGAALTEGMMEKSFWTETLSQKPALGITGNIKEIAFYKDLLMGVIAESNRRMALPVGNDVLSAAGFGETE